MSYNVAVCLRPVPDNDAVAWAGVNALIDAEGPVPPEFVELHARLTKRYPCICDLSDDVVDDGLWSDGPLINNFGHRAAVLGLVASKVNVGLPFLIQTANEMNMVVFDWATQRIHRPRKRWWPFG